MVKAGVLVYDPNGETRYNHIREISNTIGEISSFNTLFESIPWAA